MKSVRFFYFLNLMNKLKIMIFNFMAKRKKWGLVPPILHYCGHNAKKIGPKKSDQKNLCWKFARCIPLSAPLYTSTTAALRLESHRRRSEPQKKHFFQKRNDVAGFFCMHFLSVEKNGFFFPMNVNIYCLQISELLSHSKKNWAYFSKNSKHKLCCA